jgi:hypothetical protein
MDGHQLAIHAEPVELNRDGIDRLCGLPSSLVRLSHAKLLGHVTVFTPVPFWLS